MTALAAEVTGDIIVTDYYDGLVRVNAGTGAQTVVSSYLGFGSIQAIAVAPRR